DTNPDPDSGLIIPEMTAAGGRVYFVRDDGVHGMQLWWTDGTAENTGPVPGVAPLSPSVSYFSQIAPFRDGVAFVITPSSGFGGARVKRTDGTPAGTVTLRQFATGTYVGSLTDVGGTLLFLAVSLDETVLWKSNGTAGGTVFLEGFSGSN